MSSPKVSVVLSVFNGAEFLDKAIDSVLAQEYTDFEFLIYDDASGDDSVKIIESKTDSKIRFFKSQINQGWPVRFNMFIKQSNARYIRLWSQDDIMKQDCIKEELEFFEKHPEIGFSYCARDLIDKSGRIINCAEEDKTPEIIVPKLANQIMFYHGCIVGNIANVMIKKEILEEMGLFREDLSASNDFDLWVRISKKYPIGCIHKSLIKLRSHKKQLSRKKGIGLIFIRENEDIFEELKDRLPADIKEYAKKYNFDRILIMNTHYMIYSFLRADFITAKAVYKEILGRTNIFLALFLWLFTINGHFFKKKPRLVL